MLHFDRATHHFFDELVAMLLATAANSFTLNVHRLGKPHLFDASHRIWLQGMPKITNIEIGFFPLPLVTTLANNQPPNTLDLLTAPLGTNTVPNPTSVNTLIGPTERIIAGLFIGYFERLLLTVEQRYGLNNTSWPAVCNFGRVVRNAFAHGGVVNFTNPKAQPVTWRGCTLSPADNGNQLFYRYLAFAEVVALFTDLDAAV